MTKTIEEVAKRFADMKTTKQAGSSVERDKKALLMTQFFHYALEELPLSSRLTAEEKERVRKMYVEELEMAQHFHARAKWSNDISCRQHYYGLREPYISRMKLLERIFGSGFFKEEE